MWPNMTQSDCLRQLEHVHPATLEAAAQYHLLQDNDIAHITNDPM